MREREELEYELKCIIFDLGYEIGKVLRREINVASNRNQYTIEKRDREKIVDKGIEEYKETYSAHYYDIFMISLDDGNGIKIEIKTKRNVLININADISFNNISLKGNSNYKGIGLSLVEAGFAYAISFTNIRGKIKDISGKTKDQIKINNVNINVSSSTIERIDGITFQNGYGL